MSNRILRTFLCILVAFCVLVNISPVRSQAVVVESIAAYYALGLAALLLLDAVGVVYCLSSSDQITALGRNWDAFMTDGSSAFDFDLEDWEEYKKATIIQFTPNSDPDNDDDFPDGYDPNTIRIKTLESALNIGICEWLESFVTKVNILTARPAFEDVSFYGCSELVPANTHIVSPFPPDDYLVSVDGNSPYSRCLWADVDCYLYAYAYPNSTGYVVHYFFIPVDPEVESFILYEHKINQYIDSSKIYDSSHDGSIVMDSGDTYSYIWAQCTGSISFDHAKSEWFDLLLPTIHVFESSLGAQEALKYLMFDSEPKDILSPVDPSLITGTVADGVSDGFSVSDFDLPDIEYGAIIIDPSNPETAIIENQQQLANGDKTYEDYIGEVAPGHTVVVPDPIEPPETEPSEEPGVEPTEIPGNNPNSGAEANPSWLQTLLDGLWNLLQQLADYLLNGIKSIFVPSEDYLTEKVNALRDKYSFVESIISTGVYIRDSISGASGPPVIYVDLPAANGDIYWGDKVLLTDFSWYAPYKSRVDLILSAVLWAFFGWRVFMRLPGIISGESGYVGDLVGRSERIKKE